jgi:hypothetical protein
MMRGKFAKKLRSEMVEPAKRQSRLVGDRNDIKYQQLLKQAKENFQSSTSN